MKQFLNIKILCVAFSLMTLSNSLMAWTPSTKKYVAINVYKTFPEDVKLVFNPYRKDYLKGCSTKSPAQDTTALKKAILKQVNTVQEMIEHRASFKQVAYETGKLVSAIVDLSYPFKFETDMIASDYKLFAEKKLLKFPLAFIPVDEKDISHLSVRSIVNDIDSFAQSFKDAIHRDYSTFRSSSNFDELSASFGAASLLYSETCLQISKVVVVIWSQANGNINDSLIIK